jgi:hypothetical protein
VPDDESGGSRPRRFTSRWLGKETRLERAARIADAYGLVLFLILTTFVVTLALPPTGWGGRVAAIATAGITSVVAFTSSEVAPRRVHAAVVIAGAATAAAAVAKGASSDALLGAAFVTTGLLLATAAGVILRRVLFASVVDFRTILGAISVYTLLGLLFGFLLIALGQLHGGDVFTGVPHAHTREYLFFSYTTLTTTGYGNLVPAGQIGQILAVLEMLIGQIFLVTLVAGLVSLWRPGARPEAAPSERDEHGA